MVSIDKLLGLAGMGSTIANVSMLKRFLSGITVVIALTAISSTMAGMILIVALYGAYLSFVHYGLNPQAAAITVGTVAFIVTGAFAAMAVIRWRQLREMPRLLNLEAPFVNHVSQIVEAFVDGLRGGRDHRNR